MDGASSSNKSPYRSVKLGDVSQTMIGGLPYIEKISEHPRDSEGQKSDDLNNRSDDLNNSRPKVEEYCRNENTNVSKFGPA